MKNLYQLKKSAMNSASLSYGKCNAENSNIYIYIYVYIYIYIYIAMNSDLM